MKPTPGNAEPQLGEKIHHAKLGLGVPSVPPGYKQTEVGVIPEVWEVARLGDLKPFVTSGSRGWASYYSERGDLFVRITNLSRASIFLDLTDCKFVKLPPEAREGVRTQLNEHDVLISITADIGIAGYVDASVPSPAYINQHIALVRFDPSKTSGRFVSYFLASEKPQKLFRAATDTGAKAGMSLLTVQKIQTAPPPPEQRAIATALSDVDGLLSGLDRLIAKKRDLKQGAMQQLLTGQTRLPGFHGEREVKRLGDVGSTYGGLTGKTKADFGEGPARYITFMNVMSNVVIDCGTFEQVQVSPTESQNRAKKGDLFFNGSSETPEEVAMCSVLLHEVQDVYLNSFCFGFRFHDSAEADGLFLAYYLRSKEGRELMKSLAQGSTRYNLSKVALLKSPLRLPKLPEQTAIASVLGEMDGELAVLEQRREKTRALKQATFVHAYADIAQDLTEAGYSDADADALQNEVDFYSETRSAIKKHSGEELDIKPYEADMRRLLNTYVQADPAKDVGNLNSLSLTELIIETGIHDAIARKLNEKGKLSKNAIAEGIINNVRKTIIRDQLTDPRFYAEMSKLLDDLIKQSRKDAAAYEVFLKKAEELVKRMAKKDTVAGVPAVLHGNREATVIFNNLHYISPFIRRMGASRW